MEEFNKVLLYKDKRHSNDIFTILKELENYYIVNKMDTIYNTSDIISISKEYAEEFLYTATEFLNTSEFVGQTVYDPAMPELLKMVFNSFILVYKNDKNELMYDTIENKFFIQGPVFDKDNMYISDIQYPKYNFKKGLGKQ